MAVVFNWISHHNAFDPSQPELQSLSSGLATSYGDDINCDLVEEIGQSIQKTLDNVNVLECSLKRSMQVRALVELEKGVKVDGNYVHVDRNALFSRLVILLERQDVISFFKSELTPFPNFLFKSFQMRKTNKAVLKHYLTSDIEKSQPAPSMMFVLDGGALLYQVKWFPKVTYKDVVAQYLGSDKFGPSGIVFYGYNAGPSIKDNQYQRRVARTSPNIQIDGACKKQFTKRHFCQTRETKISL